MKNDDSKPATVLPSQRGDTEVGNYFVANYPPFSLWTTDQVQHATDQLDQPFEGEQPLGLYVHIPFCRKRCHFCYFRVYTDKHSSDIQQYLDAVVAELSMAAGKAFIGGRELKFIYFGGGTPSYLSSKQLETLFHGLQRAMSWDQVEEIAFECEPGTLNAKKLAAIADLGVTRLSLGIENFDDEILQLNNRAHQSKQIYEAYEWARSVGFGQINIDLIAGMLGETDENWGRCVEQALALQPDVVTIYQMEVPFNTTIYQQMQKTGKQMAPVADWTTKRKWVGEAFDALEAAGYTIGSAYTAVKDQSATKFLYRDALWSGADMLGVGVSSFGHLGGVHYQNQHNIVPYVAATQQDELPIYRALKMTPQETMIRQFVLQMKLGHLTKRPFLDQFGVDVFDHFAETLRGYIDEGYMEIRGDELRLSRNGLLQVDSMLPAFFLPEHREVRYA